MANKKNPKQAEMVTRAINANTIPELESLYNDWAETYDDYVGGLSYVAPRLGADLLRTKLPDKETTILDVGCGTGLVGTELAKHGYSNLSGIDLSEGMLEIAQSGGHYRHLAKADISQPFTHESNSFDGVICIGTLAIHVNTDPLDEMIRITAPGGYISISIRNPYYEPSGYKQHIHNLAKNNVLSLQVEKELDYILDEGATAVYILMQIS